MGEEQTQTRYAVLVKSDDERVEGSDLPYVERWEFVGIYEAATADKAKGLAAEEHEREGEYVATPARSWIPSPVALERSPRAIVGGK